MGWLMDRSCFACGAPAQADHHVVPVSVGGTKTIPLCDRCHGLVHGRKAFTSSLTAAAMARKRARLEYTGGEAPYGWTVAADGVGLEPHEGEQAVMAAARELHAGGWSLRRIGAELAARGLAPRKGVRWHASSVQRLLAAGVRLHLVTDRSRLTR